MTATDFCRKCEEYFGPWQRSSIKLTVRAYLERRAPEYMDALWPLLRDGRTVAYGAPDMKALTDFHDEACTIMEMAKANKKLPLLEDTERAAPGEVKQFWADFTAKMHEKFDRDRKGRPTERAKPGVDDVLADSVVELTKEYYDDSISLEDRMKSYAARRKGREKPARTDEQRREK